jgi:MFS family permease
MTLATSTILVFQDIDTLVYLLILSGVAIAPALIAANALMKELVPLPRLTEAFAFVGAALSIGITVGSTLSGLIVDEFGGWSGFSFMTGAMVLATLLSTLIIKPHPSKELDLRVEE